MATHVPTLRSTDRVRAASEFGSDEMNMESPLLTRGAKQGSGQKQMCPLARPARDVECARLAIPAKRSSRTRHRAHRDKPCALFVHRSMQSDRRKPAMHRLPSLFLLALLPAAAGAECRYSTDRNFDIPAAGLNTVAFDLGSSDLVIEGVPGLTQVEVRGRACASDPAWLDQLTVD